jgi:type II secretory pathway pseudopilin PulG
MEQQSKNIPGIRIKEWIILIIIIFLLALVAVPNFLEAQLRAKKSKNYAPMRVLATAIEAYYVDHNAYPQMVPLYCFSVNEKELRNAGGFSLSTFGGDLTTPTAYLSEKILDPFSPQPLPFVYFTDGKGWIIISRGPDKDYDFDPKQVYDGFLPQPSFPLQTSSFTYDPTNGTISNGDIWRVKQ